MGLFNQNPNCRVFLSSDAGAYGINLDSGTHLINFDLPWSAGALAQRTARIDRTSSEQHSVDAIFMYCSDTVEEYQYKLLQSKQMIAKAFVDGKGFTATGSLSLEMDSLRMFLNSR
jgi:SNF2 family DNA or RNA helicase